MADIEFTPGNSSGSHLAPVRKLLIHTTEGSTIEGACASYKKKNSWPHDTVDCRVGHPPRICKHLGYDVAARSLQNDPGGVQTNRDGVIQVELVGSATAPADIDWAWFGENYVGPVCRNLGIPLQSTVRWVAYPASFGERAAQRLSGPAWDAYQGLLGHQHCPENDHGDPGFIPINVVLAAASPTPAPPAPPPPPPPILEDDMEAILWDPDNGAFWYVFNKAPGRFVIQVTSDAASKIGATEGVRAWTTLDHATVEALVNEINSDVVVDVDLIDGDPAAVAAALAS